MADDSTVRIHPRPAGGMTLVANFEEALSSNLQLAIIDRIVDKVCERYVQENYAALVAGLNQEAISNLAIAEAGKKIAEEIRLKPTVVHDTKTVTEVYGHSIFGGTRRVR